MWTSRPPWCRPCSNHDRAAWRLPSGCRSGQGVESCASRGGLAESVGHPSRVVQRSAGCHDRGGGGDCGMVRFRCCHPRVPCNNRGSAPDNDSESGQTGSLGVVLAMRLRNTDDKTASRGRSDTGHHAKRPDGAGMRRHRCAAGASQEGGTDMQRNLMVRSIGVLSMGAGLVLGAGLLPTSGDGEVQCRANWTNCAGVHMEARWTCQTGQSCCTKAITRKLPDGSECIDELRVYCCIPRPGDA
jgi:hypothetical protein